MRENENEDEYEHEYGYEYKSFSGRKEALEVLARDVEGHEADAAVTRGENMKRFFSFIGRRRCVLCGNIPTQCVGCENVRVPCCRRVECESSHRI